MGQEPCAIEVLLVPHKIRKLISHSIKNLEELSAVLALARPGAMQFVDQFAAYTNNDVYEAIHPFFDDILKSTGGVCLYQEQMMKMAHKIGFTLDEAELLRRIVGKKKVKEVKKRMGTGWKPATGFSSITTVEINTTKFLDDIFKEQSNEAS